MTPHTAAELPFVVYRLASGFELTGYTGSDGSTVVEVDTRAAGPRHHDATTDPYVRVYVNDGLVYDHSPAEPLPGSPDAEGTRCDVCGQRIPDDPGGGTANRHHAAGCSLHDPNDA